MARKFFYVCAGMLMLALSYHFGYSTAAAQAPGNPVVATFGPYVAITANGDVYSAGNPTGPWAFDSNIFSGGPTPALHESWGSLKARYAPQGPTSTPATNR